MEATALVVTAEAECSRLVGDSLRRPGYSTTSLSYLAEVHSRAIQLQPNLIFLDQRYAEQERAALCEDLKLDQRTNLIPIILLGRVGECPSPVQAVQVLADACLTEPWTTERLEPVIRETTGRREEQRRQGILQELRFHFQSDVRHLDRLTLLLTPLFAQAGFSEIQVKQLGIAVRELATNAIEWGHAKQVERLVTVLYQVDAEKVVLTIRDTGPGFDPEQLAHAAQPGDPIGHLFHRDRLGLREGGFGILMARGLADELHYNETGNEVRLVKFLPSSGKSRVEIPS